MVRGTSDPIFQRMLGHLREKAPELVREDRLIRQAVAVLIMTEGETDPRHLRASLTSLQAQGRFNYLDVEFQPFTKGARSGSGDLRQFCIQAAKARQARPTIAIFDRDEKDILKDVTVEGADYKTWSETVFSLAIPVPLHRETTPEVSIELYYRDDEVKRETPEGRRLFLSNEFDSRSGRHSTENLNCTDPAKIRTPELLKIIDNQVYNDLNENVALSKSAFADLVINNAQGFNDFSFEEFAKIWDVVSQIAGGNR